MWLALFPWVVTPVDGDVVYIKSCFWPQPEDELCLRKALLS